MKKNTKNNKKIFKNIEKFEKISTSFYLFKKNLCLKLR